MDLTPFMKKSIHELTLEKLDFIEEFATFNIKDRAMAKRMAESREDLGISRAEAAWRLGVTEPYLRGIEMGRTRRTKITIEALRAFYGTRFRYVLMSVEFEDTDWVAYDRQWDDAWVETKKMNVGMREDKKERMRRREAEKEALRLSYEVSLQPVDKKCYVNSRKKKV